MNNKNAFLLKLEKLFWHPFVDKFGKLIIWTIYSLIFLSLLIGLWGDGWFRQIATFFYAI